MKWFESIIVSKESRLPWLEIHTGGPNITEHNELPALLEYNHENPLKTSLTEVISIYNNETGFNSEPPIEESIYEEIRENQYNNFIPLSNLNNFSDLKSEEISENQDTPGDQISKYSFSVFTNDQTEIHPGENINSNIFKKDQIHSPFSRPEIKNNASMRNPDFANNELVFQMEAKSSINNYLTMEVNLNQTTESTSLPSGLNKNQNLDFNDVEYNDILSDNELPIVPSEELLLTPLTAANFDELPPDEERSITDESKFQDTEIHGTKKTINDQPSGISPDIANVNNEKKNNFRCSVTPELVSAKQFHIPFNILLSGKETYEHSDPAEVQDVIEKLESTLDQFGIEARVIGMQKGPIITRYEIRIPPGIKVNRILSLTDELAMALEALRVRIEAPIPGRSTVGIEIPNKKRSTVLLGDILNHPEYNPSTVRLPLPLGKDIAGNNIIEDLTRMPHILIAGATGSGKSVAINSIITSMILSKSPEDVRLLMVDPKLVELSQYNDIPHLLHPVIADPQKAILGLNWAVEEMERRYEDMADLRARDIVSYNLKVDAHNKKARSSDDNMTKMPYIVILIDELGDLMMVAGKEVESSIIRLSQKARAIGIHLILATQRPSVDVITALIKANCPARIALQVAQKTDSRTILDSNGGEQLLGQGDMLFKHPSRAQLIRAQAPYVSDQEVENVVHRIKEMAKPSYIILEDPKSKSSELEMEDEDLFEEAWQIIIESNKASASYLQRRLRIGYNRAARLIEAFEARGYIGPQVGSKPREIIGHH